MHWIMHWKIYDSVCTKNDYYKDHSILTIYIGNAKKKVIRQANQITGKYKLKCIKNSILFRPILFTIDFHEENKIYRLYNKSC